MVTVSRLRELQATQRLPISNWPIHLYYFVLTKLYSILNLNRLLFRLCPGFVHFRSHDCATLTRVKMAANFAVCGLRSSSI